jgi:hypothetical protein
VPLPSATAIASRVRVRVGVRDDHGLLGLATPEWMPRSSAADDDDRSDARWRDVWREAFEGRMPEQTALEQLAIGRGRDGRARYDALLRDPSELGAHARAHAGPRRSAA